MTREPSRHPWLGVEVRHLVALRAIAREGSFRAAADELGYVQSAVSQQIAQLERIVGMRLIERHRGQRTVRLTTAGTLLADHAGTVLAQMHAARMDLAATPESPTAVLRVGLAHGVAFWLLPQILERIAERLPEVRVEFMEPADEDALERLVEHGDIDIGCAPAPGTQGRFVVHHVIEDPYVLLVPTRLFPNLASGELPSTAQLAALQLVAPVSSAAFAPARERLEAYGLSFATAVHATAAQAAQSFVAAGRGIAIVPHRAIDGSDPRTRTVDLTGLAPRHIITLFWLAGRRETKVLDRFAAVVRDGVKELGALPIAA